MDNQSLLELLERLRKRSQEGALVEFKSNLNEPVEVGQYISALANSAALEGANRAWMIWGVADATHEVIGTSFDPFFAKVEGNQSLIMWLQRMTTPKADFTFHQAQHSVGTVVRACAEFCVNGLMAGNCRIVRSHNEHKETRRP